MKTKPEHFLDWLLWPILALAIEPTTKIRSHFWQWIDYSERREEILRARLLTIKTNGAKSSVNKYDIVRLVPVKSYSLTHYIDNYRLGYLSKDGQVKLCTLVLNGVTSVVINDDAELYFAVDTNGYLQALKLVAWSYYEIEKKRHDIII